jgi:hypothetical protein
MTILVLGSLLLVPAIPRCVTIQEPALQQIGEKVVAVVQTKRTESLNGYLLVICKASLWKDLDQDSDIGPFLKFKTAANNLQAVLAMPKNPKDGSTYCVYLEGNKPIGFVEIKTAEAEKITEKNVAKGYLALEDSTYEPKGLVRFEQGVVHSDNDKPVPTLIVIDDGKK